MNRLAPAATLLLFLTACGGGGGGGPTAPPPPPTSGVTYTAGSSSSSNSISLVAEPGGAGSTSLVLDLRANGVTNLYGVGFNLVYPSTVLHFTGASEGTFLNGAGATSTSFQAVESPAGTLVIGISRLGLVAGASGSGILATLRFNATASGTGAFTFSHNQGLDSNGLPLGLSWSAGTVRVTLH